jgi:hypothetical protein
MNLLDLIHRTSPPEPWAEGDKIPWHDPDFSRRTFLIEEFESFWNEAQAVAIERYYIVDAETTEVTPHSISTQAYIDDQYRCMAHDAGFADVTFYPSLIGQPDERQQDFIAIMASKRRSV